MAWTHSLIRIAGHEIDTLKKRLAGIAARRADCEMRLAVLEAEAEAETERARTDAEAGWYLIGFRQGWALRREAIQAELADCEMEEKGCRDALAEAFEAQKKVEQVAETHRLLAAKEERRRETAALDEVALRRAVGLR
jgi:flagellar FliJ protein